MYNWTPSSLGAKWFRCRVPIHWHPLECFMNTHIYIYLFLQIYIYIFVYIYICIFPYIPYFFEGLRQISISRFPGPKQRWRVARGSSTSAAHADALPEMARASGLVWVDNEKSYLYAPRDWNIYLFLAYIYVEIIGKCTIVPYMEHLGYIDRLELSKRHLYIYMLFIVVRCFWFNLYLRFAYSIIGNKTPLRYNPEATKQLSFF